MTRKPIRPAIDLIVDLERSRSVTRKQTARTSIELRKLQSVVGALCQVLVEQQIVTVAELERRIAALRARPVAPVSALPPERADKRKR